MRVIITSATAFETAPALEAIGKLYSLTAGGKLILSFHQSGVGMLASAASLTRLIAEQKPDLIIQAGIAGCFDTTETLSKVVVVDKEILGDTGVQEGGEWKDLFDLGLTKADGEPYENRALPNPWLEKFNILRLPEVTGVTVNEITTSPERIKQIKAKYNPHIESMEGAPLHYICRQTGTPFLQIRAISNYIGERDKTKWTMKEAVAALNETLIAFIGQLSLSET